MIGLRGLPRERRGQPASPDRPRLILRRGARPRTRRAGRGAFARDRRPRSRRGQLPHQTRRRDRRARPSIRPPSSIQTGRRSGRACRGSASCSPQRTASARRSITGPCRSRSTCTRSTSSSDFAWIQPRPATFSPRRPTARSRIRATSRSCTLERPSRQAARDQRSLPVCSIAATSRSIRSSRAIRGAGFLHNTPRRSAKRRRASARRSGSRTMETASST
jgi:hypothetical protein